MAGLAAMPAHACGVMEKATPKVGSTVASADYVTLLFTQPVVPDASSIIVHDAAGRVVLTGDLVASKGDMVLSVTLPELSPGKYKVTWRVLWRDCDSNTRADYTFSIQ